MSGKAQQEYAMEEKWMETAPDAPAKQEKRFESWMAGNGISFDNPDAAARYRKAILRIKDAVQLKKKPDRVPVCPSPGHFPLQHAGISFYDAMYETGAISRAWAKFYTDFHPDTFSRSFIGSGRILDLLDSKAYNWPGHGVGTEREYQSVEKEFMRQDEYDDLINDPTWFHLKTYLPRICGNLSELGKLPAIVHLRHMSSMAGGLLPFDTPDFQKMLKMLVDAGKTASAWLEEGNKLAKLLMGRGYPALAGGLAEAPFDIIGDCYRGTRGVLLDMFRNPDKLIEACEKYVKPTVERAVGMADASGNPLIFMPLHKGADAFMSREQFRRFYWPSLRKVLIGLINEGLVPLAFAEAEYNSRLEIIADLPEGSAIWWFEKVDMAKAKDILAGRTCIMGDVPNALLQIGTPVEVENYCRELIDGAGDGGGFIMSTGASLQGAKKENVTAMIDFTKTYGTYDS
jgi:uroporphyrinogen-III decarboxylase